MVCHTLVTFIVCVGLFDLPLFTRTFYGPYLSTCFHIWAAHVKMICLISIKSYLSLTRIIVDTGSRTLRVDTRVGVRPEVRLTT